MIYLVLNIALFLMVAAGIGFGMGWVLRQQSGAIRESELHRGMMEIKSRIPQLETTIRNRDREVTRLSLELQDSQVRIPELEEAIRGRDADVLAGERDLRQLKNENTSLRGPADANGSAGDEHFAVLQDADLEGFDDPNRGTGDESALRQQIQVLLERIAEREQRIAVLEADGANESGSSTGVAADASDEVIGGLRRQVTDLRSRVDALQTENTELTQRVPQPGVLDDRQRSIDELQQQLDQAAAQLAERDSDISGLHSRVDTLTRESADAANPQGQAQVAERDLQVATLNARVSELDAEGEEHRRECARLERENRHAAKQLQDQLDTLRGELGDREQRIETLGQAAVERDELHDRCGQLNTQLEELREVCDQAQTTVTDLMGKVRNLEQKLIAQASHYRGQAEGIEAGQQQLETMTRASEVLERQVPELRESVDAAESALADRQSELDATRERLSELEAQLGERDSTVAALNSNVVDEEELLQQLAEKSSELESLTSQLQEASERAGASDADLQQRANQLTEQIRDLETAAATSDTQSREREQRIATLLDELASKDEQPGNANAEATSTGQGEVTELQQLVGERTAQLQELQTEATNQDKRLEEMTNQLAIKNELVADLQQQLERQSADAGRNASSDDVAAPSGATASRDGASAEQAVLCELDERTRQITRLEREQGLQQQTLQVLSQQLEDARQTHTRLSETIADRNARIAELESVSRAEGGADAPQPSLLLECQPDDCDDLQRIRGIGAALEQALNELGIYRLRQIAALNDADIKWLDDNLKGFKGRIVRDSWVEQAEELSFGG